MQKELSKNEKYSTVLLFILFLIRIFSVKLIGWILDKDYADSFTYWFGTIIYILVISVIWINKDSLQKLNVDKPFIVTLILAGLVLSILYVPFDWGIFVGLSAIFTFWALKNHQFNFGDRVSQSWSQSVILIRSEERR